MKVDPSWVITRTSDSTVEFRLVAGMSPANGGMNFDGATAGSLTLTVPIKWHVVLHFRKDRKSTRLNSSHPSISYAVFCSKKKIGGKRTSARVNIVPCSGTKKRGTECL